MTWNLYSGSRDPNPVPLPPAPPWRTFPRPSAGDGRHTFQVPPGLADAVNTALHLKRPLLLTGPPGVGKSTVVESVAYELMLGPVLRWNITSRSTLSDGIYRYDALGRLHDLQLRAARGQGLAESHDDIGAFIELGPLGTALLGGDRPRALLVDELDKGDLDLASDLLHVLERGEMEIPELARHKTSPVMVRGADPRTADAPRVEYPVHDGQLRCAQFPFIVMTSNGERDFPAPFLRRCVRFTMPDPKPDALARIVQAHIAGLDAAGQAVAHELIQEFLTRLGEGQSVATDQLLNAVYVLTRELGPDDPRRHAVKDLLLHDLVSP